MKGTDIDFHLPEHLVATRPAVPRDSCRLLVLHKDGSFEDRRFSDLADYLSPGDLLVLNNTKVFPARLTGTKKTGGKIDFLLIREIEPSVWEILSRGKYTGRVRIGMALTGDMSEGKYLRFIPEGKGHPNLRESLWDIGQMPLPPYIKRSPDDQDKESYQTVYAEHTGSIAAPTAGMHFTERLLSIIKEKGIMVRFLTLHVGIGTFKPVVAAQVENHVMESEYFEIPSELPALVHQAKRDGRRVIAVGTTTVRALEGFASGRWFPLNSGSSVSPNGTWRGTTDIFIHPGYVFTTVESLVTNFHLPRSTPLLLTGALCSMKNLMHAYNYAISNAYRFFSYGDAMLIL